MFTWFVAKRLFTEGGSSGRASRLATGIATTGVAIGLAVMLVSVAIVLGFQKEVQDKVLGFGAHIKVLNYKSLSSQELSPIVIDDSLTSRIAAIPNVASVARFCTKPGMLKTDANFRGIAIQGIGQDYDRHRAGLRPKLHQQPSGERRDARVHRLRWLRQAGHFAGNGS